MDIVNGIESFNGVVMKYKELLKIALTNELCTLYCIYGYLDSYGGGCTKYDRETSCKKFEHFKLDIDKFNEEFGINPDKV
jgi:hypothetical protein